MRIIDRVDELLKEKDLTSKQLAQDIGISAGNITDWRKDKSRPSSEVVAKIAVYLSVSTDYLLGLSDSRRPEESLAAYGTSYDDLSPEAKEELNQYAEYLRSKYGKK